MKKKIMKNLLALTVAVTTLLGSTTTCFAADVELSGDSKSTKSQTVDVSADISSLYQVTLPATVSLERSIASIEWYGTNNFDGFWCDFKIGASGKLLSNHKLVTTLEDCTMIGETTGSTFDLRTIGSGLEIYYVNLEDGSNYAGENIYPSWNHTEIGTCDFDGVSLTNCNYSYRNFYIGVKEQDMSISDKYNGNLVVNFELVTN